MYKVIMVPVDLRHTDRLKKALATAADLCRHYGAKALYVSVTSSAPSEVAHTPKEFSEKLAAFAAAQTAQFGHSATSHAVVSPDPAIDLDDVLLKAAGEVSADLIVMASHVPNIADYVWPSNGGRVAAHAKVSVLVVRD